MEFIKKSYKILPALPIWPGITKNKTAIRKGLIITQTFG